VINPSSSGTGTTATPDATRATSPHFVGNHAEPKRGFDFRRFWHSLLEKIWIVLLCVLAGFFLALGYLARTPKLYQGHIVLEVEFQEPTIITGEENASHARSAFLASQEALRTIEQNLINQTLLARVIRSEGLAEDGGRELLGQSIVSDGSSKAAARPATSPSTANATMAVATFMPLEEALGRALAEMVRPVIRRGTRLIDVYVTNRDPVMAQRLAEAVGREYIRNSIERRASFSQDALRYLLEEEERLKVNLQRSETAVAEYKEKTPDALQLGGGAAATGSQTGAGSSGGRGGLVEDKLADLNSKLTAAKTERIRLEGELKQVEAVSDNVDALLTIPSVAASQNVADRRHDVAQLQATVASLSQRYLDKHPKMIAAQAALAEAKDALRRTVLAHPAVLGNMLDQARAAEASLQSTTREQEKAGLALNKAAISYQQLARQAETDRALYESVLRQIKETSLTKDLKTNAVSVIEHSPLPGAPVSPNPAKAIMLGLLGGLAAGLVFVLGADAFDRSIRTVDQAESTLGLPVLAAVPETNNEGLVTRLKKQRQGSGSSAYRLVVETPDAPAAEAFRDLRVALWLLGPEAQRKVSLFTSALPNEGKSFTSANYSFALAQQGYRVLLIDGDLRRPNMHRIFRFPDAIKNDDSQENSGPGVIDCLLGETDVATAARPVPAGEIQIVNDDIAVTGDVHTANGGTLSVLAGGRRAPNPAEILSGPYFGQLIAEASKLFNRVVIDSAPILSVSDTLLMTPHVQTVCIVVRAARTPRAAIRRAMSLLSASGIRPAGLVLNRLRRSHGAGYYYYYGSYGPGDGQESYSRSYRHRSGSNRQDNAA
jgi:succinoglycan biosynthesis transport protein ExoP